MASPSHTPLILTRGRRQGRSRSYLCTVWLRGLKRRCLQQQLHPPSPPPPPPPPPVLPRQQPSAVNSDDNVIISVTTVTVTQTVQEQASMLRTMTMTMAMASSTPPPQATATTASSSQMVVNDPLPSGPVSQDQGNSVTSPLATSTPTPGLVAPSASSSTSSNVQPPPSSSASRSSLTSHPLPLPSSSSSSSSSTNINHLQIPSKPSLTRGQISLIVLSSIFALGLLLVCLFIYRRRRRRLNRQRRVSRYKDTLTTSQIGSPTATATATQSRRRMEDLGFMEVMGQRRLESFGAGGGGGVGVGGMSTRSREASASGEGNAAAEAVMVPGPSMGTIANSIHTPTTRVQSHSIPSPFPYQSATFPAPPFPPSISGSGYRTEDGYFYVPRSGSADKIRFSRYDKKGAGAGIVGDDGRLSRLSEVEVPKVPGRMLSRTRNDFSPSSYFFLTSY